MDHLSIIRELKHDESVLCLNTCWAYIIFFSTEQKLQERLIWLTASLGIAATVDRLRLLVRSLEANVKAMQPQTFKHNCTRLHML